MKNKCIVSTGKVYFGSFKYCAVLYVAVVRFSESLLEKIVSATLEEIKYMLELIRWKSTFLNLNILLLLFDFPILSFFLVDIFAMCFQLRNFSIYKSIGGANLLCQLNQIITGN